jgi:hypothetical protein
MSPGTPSLWEIYDTDKDLWRRGRIILATIGLFYFTSQCLILAAAIFTGNLERALALAITAVLFWLLFYFIWIGVHWIRWIWGGWNLILGFCMLIWAWRDESGMETLAACISLLIGSYLCLSPSVLFFARRQREIVRWDESLLIGAVCFLILLGIAAGGIGLWIMHAQEEKEALVFADEAAQYIYLARDFDWVLAHVTKGSLQQHGNERLQYFFADTEAQLGTVKQISPARGMTNIRFYLPARIQSEAQVISTAETDGGPVELHAVLWNEGNGWQIDRIWWRYLPLPDPAAPPRK